MVRNEGQEVASVMILLQRYWSATWANTRCGYATRDEKDLSKTIMPVFIMPIILTGMVFFAGQVYAGDDELPVEPLALRRIMQTMGDEMKTITDAISREDWALVVKTSPKIANHPQPPFSEKIQILAFAGTNVSQFKDFDGKTHESAQLLSKAAAREDGYAVIGAFSTLQKTCLACHQRFRKDFQMHFYSED
jgi:cytochrome c556